jgi:type IV secretory pathway TrbD component
MEAPIMLAVTIFAARWVVRRLPVPSATSIRLAVGFLALACLLTTEFTVVLWLRGLTLRGYLASRDPVSGTVYIASLVLFAVMPLLVARR